MQDGNSPSYVLLTTDNQLKVTSPSAKIGGFNGELPPDGGEYKNYVHPAMLATGGRAPESTAGSRQGTATFTAPHCL